MRKVVHPGCVAGFGVAVLFLVGCSGQKPVFPVKGQVVAGKNKQPAAGAILFFHPVKKDEGDPIKPMAEVDKEGKFSLTTHKADDGAAAGEYVVTIIWPPAKKSLFDKEETDRLRGAYADVAKSKIRFTVQAGVPNEVPVIELP